ncbi:uracil-DNA glycosylase [bacterium]|nr:uracil-DNA glycosylase [bacterium]
MSQPISIKLKSQSQSNLQDPIQPPTISTSAPTHETTLTPSTPAPTVRDLIAAIPTTWRPLLERLVTPYQPKINAILEQQHKAEINIFPAPEKIFEAFRHFDIDETRAVIVGMDVYPTKGHATGLAFAVPPATKPIPPSLKNIIKELEEEFPLEKWPLQTHGGDISHWAKTEHVLMINTALTVQEGTPGSHIQAWYKFTRDIIMEFAGTHRNIVYILWGNHARTFSDNIDYQKNLILSWSHPSPLSRKLFLGNGHFRKCNEYLKQNGITPIKWFPH